MKPRYRHGEQRLYDPSQVTMTIGGKRILFDEAGFNLGELVPRILRHNFGMYYCIERYFMGHAKIESRRMAWAKEFSVFVETDQLSDLAALFQGVRKWSGTLPENLDRFGLVFENIDTYLMSTNCALCWKYYKGDESCGNCPLKISGHRCEATSSLYYIARARRDPKPLIHKLTELAKACNSKGEYLHGKK